MTGPLIFYVPLDFVEAVGWGGIVCAQLGVALDALAAVVEPVRVREQRPFEPLQAKADRLRLAASGVDRRDWRARIEAIADAVERFDDDLHNAAVGTLYGRGLNGTALDLRRLYEKVNSTRVMSRMTKAKLEELVERMDRQTRRAASLAMEISCAQEG